MPFTLGILEAGALPPAERAAFGSMGSVFARFFVAEAAVATRPFAAYRGELPDRLDACDGYLITGSLASAFDDQPWIADLAAFSRALDRQAIRQVGICFGHQLIARAFGGNVARSAKGWGLGVMRHQIIAGKPWMTPTLPRLSLMACHRDQVLRAPDRAEVLASSGFCPIAMMQLGPNIMTMQSHPEVDRPLARALLDGMAEGEDAAAARDAQSSLGLPTDEDTARAWITGFLTA